MLYLHIINVQLYYSTFLLKIVFSIYIPNFILIEAHKGHLINALEYIPSNNYTVFL